MEITWARTLHEVDRVLREGTNLNFSPIRILVICHNLKMKSMGSTEKLETIEREIPKTSTMTIKKNMTSSMDQLTRIIPMTTSGTHRGQ